MIRNLKKRKRILKINFNHGFPDLKLNSIIENENCCPFDGRVFDLFEKDIETVKILENLYSVYERVDFQFSSPGNSFRRNVCFEIDVRFLTKKYQERLTPLSFCEKYSELKDEFKKLIDQLLLKTAKLKFQDLNSEKLKLISSPKFENGFKLKSEILNPEGIQAAINTFSNFPTGILEKIQFQ